MIRPEAKLAANLFDKPDMAATRDGFGKGATEAGKADPRVVVLSADLAESVRADWFEKEFPDRLIEVGVAEQNLVTVASGMAAYGKRPFATSFAAFNPGRNWEQIRTTICINDVPVVVCGMHAGLMTGPDGATHQMLEDIALMRALPNMRVIVPCDAEEARKATIAAAQVGKPVYLRFGRDKMPTMTTADSTFTIGKATVFWKNEPKNDGPRVALFAAGPVLYNALLAAKELAAAGIGASVTNVHTIKPLDVETVVAEARSAGAVVTVEDHQIIGGLGSAIAECLAANYPAPIEYVGIKDKFGQSGSMKELYEAYGLSPSHIVAAAKKAMARK
jgi:transketolase